MILGTTLMCCKWIHLIWLSCHRPCQRDPTHPERESSRRLESFLVSGCECESAFAYMAFDSFVFEVLAIVLDRPPKTEPNQTVKETEADTERCYVTVPT
ncbi:Uncharacterized protein TCM_029977 [Theobroma cacao]|uniref:Secreted protein n=1 Tax=Theobroma cacao TaxID=3641 RepID=A0A061GMQ7_THECC|nr:Uncharacterized protein TCM_029977 [Theobroma cacao]